MLQRHYNEFLRQLEYINQSRKHFKYIKALDAKHLTDIERAARFYYLLRASFGGMAQSYGADKVRAAKYNLNNHQKNLAHTVNRLRSVAMENLDFEEFIKKYDSKDTLFYLDPPYYGNENDYGKELIHTCLFIYFANPKVPHKLKTKLFFINLIINIKHIYFYPILKFNYYIKKLNYVDFL